MKKLKILIHLEGGVVQDVFVNHPDDIEMVVLRDFDIQGSERDIAEEGHLFRVDDRYADEHEITLSYWRDLKQKPFENEVTSKEFDGDK